MRNPTSKDLSIIVSDCKTPKEVPQERRSCLHLGHGNLARKQGNTNLGFERYMLGQSVPLAIIIIIANLLEYMLR